MKLTIIDIDDNRTMSSLAASRSELQGLSAKARSLSGGDTNFAFGGAEIAP
jgi:hypothetical protein